MIKPNVDDLIQYAEGADDLRADMHRELIQEVSKNIALQEELAKIRKDLYLIQCQIPEYALSKEAILEINKLAEVWLRKEYKLTLRWQKFLLGKNFFILGLIFIACILLALALSRYI